MKKILFRNRKRTLKEKKNQQQPRILGQTLTNMLLHIRFWLLLHLYVVCKTVGDCFLWGNLLIFMRRDMQSIWRWRWRWRCVVVGKQLYVDNVIIQFVHCFNKMKFTLLAMHLWHKWRIFTTCQSNTIQYNISQVKASQATKRHGTSSRDDKATSWHNSGQA